MDVGTKAKNEGDIKAWQRKKSRQRRKKEGLQ
jgi:hypothetical protein